MWRTAAGDELERGAWRRRRVNMQEGKDVLSVLELELELVPRQEFQKHMSFYSFRVVWWCKSRATLVATPIYSSRRCFWLSSDGMADSYWSSCLSVSRSVVIWANRSNRAQRNEDSQDIPNQWLQMSNFCQHLDIQSLTVRCEQKYLCWTDVTKKELNLLICHCHFKRQIFYGECSVERFIFSCRF